MPVSGLVLALVLAAAPATAGGRCGACHPVQLRQWRTSLHAHSLDDPLYVAMRAWAARDQGPDILRRCANCHTTPILGTRHRTAGVTCAVCHQGRVAAPGPKGWRVDPEAPVLGPGRGGPSAPHAVAAMPAPGSGRPCLVCHGELRNPHGVALCTTGPEAAAGGSSDCRACHMPGGDHTFGATGPRLLRAAAALDVDLSARTVRVAVINRGAGHAIPTGSALRRVVLLVTFRDAAGRPLASHREIFARIFKDAAGRTPAPPWRAVAVSSDTRLPRGRRRAFVYPIPAEARTVEARLVFLRAPAALLARLDLAADPLARPVEMARMVRTIPGGD